MPVPLEVSTLLSCFFTLANHPNYANSIIKQIDGINKEAMDKFSNELCLLLCEETTDSIKNDNAFCRHILFQNKRFGTEVLRAMWDKEIEERYKKLKELLLQVSFDMQAAVILDCLRALDLSIVKLESAIRLGVSTPEGKTDSAVQDEEPLPQELLKQLLSWRIQEDTTNAYALYKVHNTMINSKMNMQEAFRKLAIPSRDKDLLQQARRSYLSNLSESIESQETVHIKQALEFEQKYNEIKKYLDHTAFPVGCEELTSSVTDYCRQYCLNIIEFCTYNPASGVALKPPFSDIGYGASIIDCIIQYHMNNAVNRFKDTIYLISYFNALSNGEQISRSHYTILFDYYQLPSGLLKLAVPIPEYGISFCCANALYFSEFLHEAWSYLFNDNLPIFYANTYKLICPDKVAKTLYNAGASAAAFFGKEEFFYTSEEKLRMALDAYQSIVSTPEAIISPRIFTESIPNLMLVILYIVLYSTVNDTVPLIIEDIKLYFSSP